MKISICTLFEGNYHHGVAGLINSLCQSGFKGTVYVGYRGELPPWMPKDGSVTAFSEGEHEFPVTSDVKARFLRLTTDYHFSNYKAVFLLDLFRNAAADSDAIYYFDPDIVATQSWDFFEDWISCGVTLCEDVNSPCAVGSPRRVGWRRFFAEHQITLHPGEVLYANAGFIGIQRQHQDFLVQWQTMINLALEFLGGKDVVGIGGGRQISTAMGFADCFRQPDQDALNAAIEAMPAIPISFESKRAMGFEPGVTIVPHALGSAKPWKSDYLRRALTHGHLPSTADKAFWRYVDGPIAIYPPAVVKRQRKRVNLAAGIGRFYRRN